MAWYQSQINNVKLALEVARMWRKMGFHAKAVECQMIAHRSRVSAITCKRLGL